MAVWGHLEHLHPAVGKVVPEPLLGEEVVRPEVSDPLHAADLGDVCRRDDDSVLVLEAQQEALEHGEGDPGVAAGGQEVCGVVGDDCSQDEAILHGLALITEVEGLEG